MRASAGVLFRLAAAFALGATCTQPAAMEPALLVPGSDPISLVGHVGVLRDDAGQWTLDDVRSPALAAQFDRDDRARLNFGFTRTARWYRVTLQAAATGGPAEWVFTVDYPVLDHVDIHVVRSDGATTTALTGDLRPPSRHQLDVRPFAVPIRTEPGDTIAVYVRVQTAGQHLVPLSLWSSGRFTAETAMANSRDGAYLGVFAVMALYNFVVFVWLRDRAYLWYSLYLTNVFCFALVVGGLARQHGNDLFADAPRWIGSAYTLLQGLTHLLLLLFSREFLMLPRHAPRLDSVARGLVALSAIAICLWPVLPYSLANQANTYLGATVMAYLMGISAYLAARGVRPARFFLAAWCVMTAVFMWATLAAVGVVASSFWTTHGFAVGLIIVIVLLSAALADRVLQERKDRFAVAERARRLKDFLPQRVADLVGAGDHALLEPRRRNVTACMIDLRGFTPFAERAPPEEVMAVLREFYDTMGRAVERHGGTVEHFAGDSMLIFFNAPLEIPQPQAQAMACALGMRAAFEGLRAAWGQRGHELGLGIGIADGEATIGAIGFSGRSQYAAIGAVTNLASRLCSKAQHGEILTTARVVAAAGDALVAETVGAQEIRGFSQPVHVARIVGLRPAAVGPGLQPDNAGRSPA